MAPPRFLSQLGLSMLTVALLGNSALAEPQRRGLPGPRESKLPDRDVVLPMIRFHRLPMVELKINGTGPYRMIVDTGAAGVVVRPSLAKKLQLPAPPGIPAGMNIQVKTPSGNVPATLHNIEELTLGGAGFRGVWTIAASMPFGDDMDGVIGMNVFKECLLTYDYPGNRVILSKGALPVANGEDVLEYTTPQMPDSHPYVKLKIDGRLQSTFIDSGMSGWFSVPAANPRDLKFLREPVEARMGMSVGGKMPPLKAARLQATFSVGKFTIKDPIVLMSTQYMIGTHFLENFAVTFDGRNKRVRFERRKDEALVQPPMRSLGFSLKREGAEMLVWYLHPKSDAAAQGLKLNDIVVEIEGKPARDVYQADSLRDAVMKKASVSVRYKRPDGRDIKTGTFRIMELFR